MGQQIEALAKFAAETRWEDIPAAVQKQTKLVLLDTLGVILAAILLTLLPEILRPVAEYRMIIYSLMLIILMLARPQGLFNFKLGKAKT